MNSAKPIIEKSWLEDSVTPDYSQSIASIPHTIMKLFGVKTKNPLPSFDIKSKPKNVVLICLDGLGYDSFKSTKGLRKLDHVPISSIAPSTTWSALPTLATGLTPQQHGIMGYRTFFRELGHVTNMMSFGPSLGFGSFEEQGIDPTLFFPHKNLYQKLKPKVKSYVFNKQEYIHSPFTKMLYRASEKVPYIAMTDMFTNAQNILQKPGKKLLYLYWPTLDLILHNYGKESRESIAEIKNMDRQVSGFIDSLKNSLVILTADHGFINSGKSFDLSTHPKLINKLEAPPSGEPRLTYFHCRKNKQDDTMDYLNQHFSKKAHIFKSQDLLDKGLFGASKKYKETQYRVGDITMIAKKNYSFTFPFLDGSTVSKGLHGGLSKEEMIVPLAWKKT